LSVESCKHKVGGVLCREFLRDRFQYKSCREAILNNHDMFVTVGGVEGSEKVDSDGFPWASREWKGPCGSGRFGGGLFVPLADVAGLTVLLNIDVLLWPEDAFPKGGPDFVRSGMSEAFVGSFDKASTEINRLFSVFDWVIGNVHPCFTAWKVRVFDHDEAVVIVVERGS